MAKRFDRQDSQVGVVVSDLHLFARRSCAESRLRSLQGKLEQAKVIILNGDTFDFRWSTRGDFDCSRAAAAQWLTAWASKYPGSVIHYILGNHDCLEAFTEDLDRLSRTLPAFHWYRHCLRLGSSIFLHGDCAQRLMDGKDLELYRETWRNDRQRGSVAAAGYRCIDVLGITRLAHAWHFPTQRTIRRVVHFLGQIEPGWTNGISDCYFGHTHRPFSNIPFRGVRFHNTGSAIRDMRFHPISFALAEDQRIISTGALGRSSW